MALSRVVAVTPQPRHWWITANSGCSRHSDHTTTELGGAGSGGCLRSVLTDGPFRLFAATFIAVRSGGAKCGLRGSTLPILPQTPTNHLAV